MLNLVLLRRADEVWLPEVVTELGIPGPVRAHEPEATGDGVSVHVTRTASPARTIARLVEMVIAGAGSALV